jgi:hypothetical protein
MRKALIGGIFALAASSVDAGEYYVEFQISGSFTVQNLTRLRIEIDTDGVFMGAHGAGNFNMPATGTCFPLADGRMYCNFQADQLSFNLELQRNLSGTITSKDASGFITDTAPVSLYDIYPSNP